MPFQLVAGFLLLLSGAAASYPADYLAWDRALKRHVAVNGSREGMNAHLVDYCGMKADSDFHQFLTSLAAADAHGLSKEGLYALYMNAYNALAVNMLIRFAKGSDGKCIQSIQNISNVWTQFAGVVAGTSMSLNDIEGLLRNPSAVGFKEDCRVHGCIVCASLSCPNLRAEAYLPETLDAQMTDNVRDWLANPKKGSGLDGGTLTVTKIINFFPSDFITCSGSDVDFVAEYAPPEVASFIAQTGAKNVHLHFFDYNWDANGNVPCECPPSQPDDTVIFH